MALVICTLMILVVDDYLDSAELLARMLRMRGYPTRASASAHEALTIIRGHPPEQPLLVVMDVMMPLLTGVEALEIIRSEPEIAGTAVVFFTAGFDVRLREQARMLGALGWFFKGGPDFDSILKEITRLYEGVGGVSLSANLERQTSAR